MDTLAEQLAITGLVPPQVWLVVLGAILALATGVITEFLRFRFSDRRTKRLFKSLLRNELPELVAALHAIVDECGKLGYLPYKRLNEIQSARQGFDRNRDWVILFSDNSARQSLMDFYRDLSSTTADAYSIEQLAGAQKPEYDAHVKEQRQWLRTKFTGLESQGRTLLGQIDSL